MRKILARLTPSGGRHVRSLASAKAKNHFSEVIESRPHRRAADRHAPWQARGAGGGGDRGRHAEPADDGFLEFLLSAPKVEGGLPEMPRDTKPGALAHVWRGLTRHALAARYLHDIRSTYPQPHAGVLDWLRRHHHDCAIAAASFAEIHYGIACLPHGAKRNRLQAWALELAQQFDGRILASDDAVWRQFGDLKASLRAMGRMQDALDMVIAATALHHGLPSSPATRATLKTRASGSSTPGPTRVPGLSNHHAIPLHPRPPRTQAFCDILLEGLAPDGGLYLPRPTRRSTTLR